MATHPKKAVVGAVRGRPQLLPPARAGEVYALTSTGFTMWEVAEELGVSRSTLQKRRNNSTEFLTAIKGGRAEFARRRRADTEGLLLLASRAARQSLLRQAQAVAELVGFEPPPGALRTSELGRKGVAATARDAGAFGRRRPIPPNPVVGDAVPIADPLGDEYSGEGAAMPLLHPY